MIINCIRFLGILLIAVFQTGGMVIDGRFNDWTGQPYITDSAGDGPNPNSDLINFYWATNPGEENIYWMIERSVVNSGNPQVYYQVGVDTNNNGNYKDTVDRLIKVHYDPQRNIGFAEIFVYSGNGSLISQSNGDWGETADEGGSRMEFRVSFVDLGIDARQAISMYVDASQNKGGGNTDRLPEGSGDITWTPIPVLGWVGLIIIVTAVILFTWYRYGKQIWKTASPLE